MAKVEPKPEPTKRAVLIGINYIDNKDNRLNGCVNDVLLVRDMLIKRYKFAAANVMLLIDEGNDGKSPKPTGKNIIAALQAGIKASKPGDTLYVHYSGHGSFQADQSGDETDKRDELLVGADFVFITDDILRAETARLADGVKFTMVSDSCNSGTVLDQPDSDIRLTGDKGKPRAIAAPAVVVVPRRPEESERPSKPRTMSREQCIEALKAMYKSPADYLKLVAEMPGAPLAVNAAKPPTWEEAVRMTIGRAPAAPAAAAAPVPKGTAVKDKAIVLMSGCQDDQLSSDAWSIDGSGKWYGALTYCLVDTINRKTGTISYWDAIKGARDRLAAKGFDQNPTLSCKPELVSQPFIE